MGLFFLFMFLLWGWAEMSTFIFIGGEIGGLLTLIGVFVTAIIGLSLLKSQGNAVMNQFRNDMAQGLTPVGSVSDSIALVVGGILMLIPGYVTDVVGVLLFVPGIRTIIGAWILHQFMNNDRFKRFAYRKKHSGFNEQATHSFYEKNEIIEGDATELPKKDPTK